MVDAIFTLAIMTSYIMERNMFEIHPMDENTSTISSIKSNI